MRLKMLWLSGLVLLLGSVAVAQQLDDDAIESDAKQLAASGLPALQQKAESGDVRAQLELGSVYENGYAGATKSDQEAVRWYTRAAAGGNPTAQRWLGNSYISGQTGSLDVFTAAGLYQKAAAQGDSKAKDMVAKLQCDSLCNQIVQLAKSDSSDGFASERGEVKNQYSGGSTDWNSKLTLAGAQSCGISFQGIHGNYMFNCYPGLQPFDKYEDAANTSFDLFNRVWLALGSGWKVTNASSDPDNHDLSIELEDSASKVHLLVNADESSECLMKEPGCKYWTQVSVHTPYTKR